jgi:hypothetical protein
VDRVHLLLALAYVDQNPLRAAMVTRASDYGWSSALAHVRREDPSGLLDLAMWGKSIGPKSGPTYWKWSLTTNK